MFNLSTEQEERAKRLHKESIVVDSLAGTNGAVIPAQYPPDILKRGAELVKEGVPIGVIHRKLERMYVEDLISGRSDTEREWIELSGVDVFHMTTAGPGRGFEHTVAEMALWQRKIDSLDYLVKATTFKDIEQAKAQGKKAIIMGFQNSWHFGRDFAQLQCFYDLGIRIIQLTYNLGNLVGSGCTERADGGLTAFGIEVVKRMNKSGILVDVSHCGYKTTMDAIEISSSPVIVTHSSSSKIFGHVRGKSDEVLQALAAKNGYFGVLTFSCCFCDLTKKGPSLNDVLDHIDHIAGIMGVDKVGIGTDESGLIPEPMRTKTKEKVEEKATSMGWREEHQVPLAMYTHMQGYSDQREWPNFTRGLVSRGYSDDEIKGILGGNFLRVFKEVAG